MNKGSAPILNESFPIITMHARKLLGLSLLFCGVSLAEHIPPNHILWGEKGPPGATLLPKTRASHTVAEPLPLEERDTPCTNGPKSRSCWASGYSVSTDFDAKWPTTNVRTVTVSDSKHSHHVSGSN